MIDGEMKRKQVFALIAKTRKEIAAWYYCNNPRLDELRAVKKSIDHLTDMIEGFIFAINDETII